MHAKRFALILVWGLLVVSMLAYSMRVSAGANTARLQQGDIQVCYAMADEGGVGGVTMDRLTQITYINGVNGAEELLGDPGTDGVENLAFDIHVAPGGVLYGVDDGVLGTFDLANQGQFTPVGGPIGSGTGSEGTVQMVDIDGLAFDTVTGALYASVRREASDTQRDLLIQIDKQTGALVQDAFGGNDYVAVDPALNLYDIDDIAFDPVDGQLFGIANTEGRQDQLVIINKQTGDVTHVGPLTSDIDATTIYDMEGLTFDTLGRMLGTTGKDGGGRSNRLWIIDQTSALINESATAQLSLGNDYEAISCLTSATVITVTPTITPPTVTETPTAVELVSFEAQAVAAGVVRVYWTTAMEIDNAAFHIYRGSSSDWTRAEPVGSVPAAGGVGGHTYSFTDRPPADGQWFYWLVDEDTSGVTTRHGPVSVQLGTAPVQDRAIFIPFLARP